MSVMRIRKHDDHYVSVNRSFFDDDRLSLRTKGLIGYLMTKPDNWTINHRHLMTIGPDGRDAILGSLRQAGECGYLERKRVQDSKGRWSWEQTLWDYPTKAREDQFRVRNNRTRSTRTLSKSKNLSSKERSSKTRLSAVCDSCGGAERDGSCWCEVAS